MPNTAKNIPTYWYQEIVLNSPNKKSPTKIVLTVNNESIVAELTAKPNFDVTKPKVKKTNGEIIKIATNHIVLNLSSFPAQIALTELAKRATSTAIII